ncbi:glyoxal reductase-like [Spea bombifrons]|uniref:glyoxal reductase-like n=1 Tax=Spea bombifrons TaxID=233779 RepID=UPI00234AF61D|nr:glyoxal reductase-like [Spea bombifrons]
MEKQTSFSETVTLNNGVTMPLLGLGTFHLRGLQDVTQSVDAALACGYRLFDTASVYRNEEELGHALHQLLPLHGLTRSDIFITSKLSPADLGKGAREACLRSLERLGCEYLDLYLIHWPGRQGWKSDDARNAKARQEAWKSMEDLYEARYIRAVGVSNYTETHLAELLTTCRVWPAVLQVEFHPWLPQKSLLNWCRENGVSLQAYSSLGCGDLLNKEEVKKVAKAHRKTTSQVLLRWALKQGVGVIPKSADPSRIKSNFDVWDFDLSEEDMQELSGDGKEHRYCWNPKGVA